MEEHPRLNAGYGSALTERGTVECDASIMEGDALQAGAVGAVSGVRSAIGLARRILEDGRHILLVGDGALTFARDQGLPLCAPDALVTDRQRRNLAEHLAARQETGAQHASGAVGGTVGAVAIDVHGRIVAGTSTGGYTGKRPGRVGDSALIGAGTYADSRLGGVSTTGHGEAFIRTVLAKTALDILRELDDPQLAADVSLDVVREDGRGNGGPDPHGLAWPPGVRALHGVHAGRLVPGNGGGAGSPLLRGSSTPSSWLPRHGRAQGPTDAATSNRQRTVSPTTSGRW